MHTHLHPFVEYLSFCGGEWQCQCPEYFFASGRAIACIPGIQKKIGEHLDLYVVYKPWPRGVYICVDRRAYRVIHFKTLQTFTRFDSKAIWIAYCVSGVVHKVSQCR